MNHSCDSSAWMDDEATLVARRDIELKKKSPWTMHCLQRNQIGCWILVVVVVRHIVAVSLRAMTETGRCTGKISKSFFPLSIADRETDERQYSWQLINTMQSSLAVGTTGSLLRLSGAGR